MLLQPCHLVHQEPQLGVGSERHNRGIELAKHVVLWDLHHVRAYTFSCCVFRRYVAKMVPYELGVNSLLKHFEKIWGS